MSFGIPYPESRVESSPTGPKVIRTCPECNKEFSEDTDQFGELTTNKYGQHYSEEHQ